MASGGSNALLNLPEASKLLSIPEHTLRENRADGNLSIDCGEDDMLRTWIDWYTEGVAPAEDELNQVPSCTVSAWEQFCFFTSRYGWPVNTNGPAVVAIQPESGLHCGRARGIAR